MKKIIKFLTPKVLTYIAITLFVLITINTIVFDVVKIVATAYVLFWILPEYFVPLLILDEEDRVIGITIKIHTKEFTINFKK